MWRCLHRSPAPRVRLARLSGAPRRVARPRGGWGASRDLCRHGYLNDKVVDSPRAARARRSRGAPQPPLGRAGTGAEAESAEQALVGVLVEADDQLASLAERRRAQVAGRTQQEREQLGARGLLALEVEVHDLLALGDVELVHVLQGAEGGVALDRGFLGVSLRGHGDLVLRKEPLRFGAGRSALAVVAPVDGAHGALLIRRGSLQRDRGT